MDPQSSSSQDLAPKIFINGLEFIDNDDESLDQDIYRGDRHSTLQTPEPGPATSIKSVSSASSGSGSSVRLAGGRLGALATRLERAITRWARKNWADSSSSVTSSSSSDSSRSSFRTANKSSRRKRRPPSIADIQQREQSERAIAARIRAREIGRAVPREFNLYAPPLFPLQDPGPIEEEQRVMRAFSLDVMLPHLDRLLRKPGKPRRSRHRSRSRTESDQARDQRHLHPQQGHSAEDAASIASRTDALNDPSLTAEKGKDKIPCTTPSLDPLQVPLTFTRDSVARMPRQAWWLDVASPSWEDMKTLGRLLHIHPLTLEDTLQQEPREKLEFFPNLGYYFIVFRALGSSIPHERLDVVSHKTGSSQLPLPAQDVANEIYIYLVVFRDGICTFHFSNISGHLDRVREKLQPAAQTARGSSAWIAHGILDSVVDSFSPFVKEIEEHVTAIESSLYNEDTPASTITPIPLVNTLVSRALPAGEKAVPATSFVDEKHVLSRDVSSVKTAKTQFSLPRPTCGHILRRLRRALTRFVGYGTTVKTPGVQPSFARASFDLHRIARTRRLVTSVARVLATKPEVVAGIRKRLLASDGLAASDDAEVAIYFGDVQDHILTLQQSLAHYERMLSESHSMYLQNLRVDFLRTRAKKDFAEIIFTSIAVGFVVLPEALVGMFSMNIQTPHNGHGYWVFWMVCLGLVLIEVLFLGLIRSWWVSAKQKRGAVL
ncbi:hypothetical protein BJV74DRAFT_811126 [Russula compacta]|nr:hypothetical protein BJV74DRAFT_811126 [Russula compacta]